MLISHRYKFIYFKTVKTAGTSIETALEKYCLPEGHDDVPVVTPKIETEAGVIGARGHFAETEHWRNHMQAADIRRGVSPEVWDGYYKFCNLRNPWDKTVSWFHFKNPAMKGKSHDEIVTTFRTWLRAAHSIGQDQKIYMIENVPVMDDYIHYESMADDFDRICNNLGLEPGAIPRHKTKERGQKKIPYQQYYDAATRNIVANRYKTAIAHFDWAF